MLRHRRSRTRSRRRPRIQPPHHPRARLCRPRLSLRPVPCLRAAVVLLAFGAILLDGGLDPVRAGTPAPVELDPSIVGLLTEVSADSLFASVQMLQNFQSRNTASDTLSPTTGIGAARRWVHERFADHGVEAGWFDWQAEVCTVDRVHRNVLGTVVGSEPERLVVVGGHLDSRTVDLCNTTGYQPAANDDASGIACLIELARLLPALDLEASVVLQAFAGEEQGLLGSDAYSAYARDNGLDVDAMINNDTIGNIDGCPGLPDCGGGPTTHEDSLSVRAFAGDPATGSSRQLARLAKRIGEAYVEEMTVALQAARDRPGRGGDHIPFYEDGFPAIRFIETLEYTLQQHNANDLIDHMEFGYLRRNVLLNLALVANLAMAPERPTSLQVFDLGTGGAIRVQWPSVPGDVDGYLVAYRYVDQGDTLYWADVVDAGGATSLDITGLADEVALAVSVAAYDGAGHESLFTDEALIVPGVVPHVPPVFRAVSRPDRVELSWATPPELDLDRFRIWRSTNPETGFAVLDSVDASATSYDDTGALSGVDYYYRLTSVDLDGLESPATESEKGRLQELADGLLLVDATRNGSGGLGNPNDTQVDAVYAQLLAGAPILAHWDWTTQFDGAGIPLTDADMGRYRTVFLHCDLRNNNTIDEVVEELGEYVGAGGQLFLCGWGLKTTLANESGEVAEFGPGDFFHDVLRIGAMRTAANGESDFAGADPLDSSFPPLNVDTGRWPFQDGKLIFMDAVVGPLLDGAAPLEAYRSSTVPPGPNHGRTVGLKWPVVSPRVIFLDVPLYFMQTAGAQAFVDQALADFGYGPASAPLPSTGSALFFSARPNPTRGGTTFSFYLRGETAVSLEIFDVQGRAVRALWKDATLRSGRQEIAFDGRDDAGRRLAAGIYFANLRVGGESYTQELTLLGR